MEYPSTPADYKIVHLEGGDFTDANGNVWCNVLFEGYTSEPIKWVVKDMSKYKVGDTVHGHFETKTSKANKPYLRFYRDQQQQWGGAPQQAGQVAQAKYGPKDDHTQESIARSVALKAAVDLFVPFMSPENVQKMDGNILGVAEIFLAWLQGNSPMPKLADIGQTVSVDMAQTADEARSFTKPVDPNKPWERITKKEQHDERDEYNDMRQSNEDIPPEYM